MSNNKKPAITLKKRKGVDIDLSSDSIINLQGLQKLQLVPVTTNSSVLLEKSYLYDPETAKVEEQTPPAQLVTTTVHDDDKPQTHPEDPLRTFYKHVKDGSDADLLDTIAKLTACFRENTTPLRANQQEVDRIVQEYLNKAKITDALTKETVQKHLSFLCWSQFVTNGHQLDLSDSDFEPSFPLLLPELHLNFNTNKADWNPTPDTLSVKPSDFEWLSSLYSAQIWGSFQARSEELTSGVQKALWPLKTELAKLLTNLQNWTVEVRNLEQEFLSVFSPTFFQDYQKLVFRSVQQSAFPEKTPLTVGFRPLLSELSGVYQRFADSYQHLTSGSYLQSTVTSSFTTLPTKAREFFLSTVQTLDALLHQLEVPQFWPSVDQVDWLTYQSFVDLSHQASVYQLYFANLTARLSALTGALAATSEVLTEFESSLETAQFSLTNSDRGVSAVQSWLKNEPDSETEPDWNEVAGSGGLNPQLLAALEPEKGVNLKEAYQKMHRGLSVANRRWSAVTSALGAFVTWANQSSQPESVTGAEPVRQLVALSDQFTQDFAVVAAALTEADRSQVLFLHYWKFLKFLLGYSVNTTQEVFRLQLEDQTLAKATLPYQRSVLTDQRETEYWTLLTHQLEQVLRTLLSDVSSFVRLELLTLQQSLTDTEETEVSLTELAHRYETVLLPSLTANIQSALSSVLTHGQSHRHSEQILALNAEWQELTKAKLADWVSRPLSEQLLQPRFAVAQKYHRDLEHLLQHELQSSVLLKTYLQHFLTALTESRKQLSQLALEKLETTNSLTWYLQKHVNLAFSSGVLSFTSGLLLNRDTFQQTAKFLTLEHRQEVEELWHQVTRCTEEVQVLAKELSVSLPPGGLNARLVLADLFASWKAVFDPLSSYLPCPEPEAQLGESHKETQVCQDSLLKAESLQQQLLTRLDRLKSALRNQNHFTQGVRLVVDKETQRDGLRQELNSSSGSLLSKLQKVLSFYQNPVAQQPSGVPKDKTHEGQPVVLSSEACAETEKELLLAKLDLEKWTEFFGTYEASVNEEVSALREQNNLLNLEVQELRVQLTDRPPETAPFPSKEQHKEVFGRDLVDDEEEETFSEPTPPATNTKEKELEKLVNQLKEQLEAKAQEVESLQFDLSTLSHRQEKAKSQVLETHLSNLEAQKVAFTEESQKLTRQRDKALAKVRGKESEVLKLKSQNAALLEQVAALSRSSPNKASVTVVSPKTSVTTKSTESETKNHQREVQQLEVLSEQLAADNLSLKRQLKDLKKTLSEHNQKLEQCVQKAEVLESELGHCTANNTKLQDYIEQRQFY